MKKVRAALAAFVVMSLLGCVTGAPIQTERVKSIIPGKTTRSDLFDMFGTPVAVAAHDGTLTLPPIAIMGEPFSNRSFYRLRADTFFALFSETNDYHRIYYYQMYYLHYSYIRYFGEYGNTKTDRLWVLVNEKTGIVEDYAFKRYEEDTVFGRPPKIETSGSDH